MEKFLSSFTFVQRTMDTKKPLITPDEGEQSTNRVQISSRSPSIIPTHDDTMSYAPPPLPNHNDSHEMHQRNSKGFQKLNSNDPSPSATPEPQNRGYFSPPPPPPPQGGQPYYNYGTPPPGQPGYGTPPPGQPYYGGPQYPLIAQVEEPLPYGYNRPLWKRLLIGPIQTPIFSYLSALAMTGVLILEFVRYHNLTGSVIQTSPFNPMIGPSFQVRVCVSLGR